MKSKSQSLEKIFFKLIEENAFSNQTSLWKNLVSLSTDNGKNFSGSDIGFCGQINAFNPNIYFQSCLCHNSDLIAEDTADSLPNQITSLLKDISKEFAHSHPKKNDFEKILSKLNLEIKSPKKWNEVRWLSLDIFLEDFFVQLPAFIEYFKQNDQKIHKSLKNKLNTALIAFLKMMTEDFCLYNKIFQSDDANPYTLYTKQENIL